MSVYDANAGIVHGYVLSICSTHQPNYFTGCGFSSDVCDAKVFRTERGAKVAVHYWQHTDNPTPLPPGWYASRKTHPVLLTVVSPML